MCNAVVYVCLCVMNCVLLCVGVVGGGGGVAVVVVGGGGVFFIVYLCAWLCVIVCIWRVASMLSTACCVRAEV